ncbi:MAG: helix-turn-helix domain-containing protein [Acidimicrobiales bacterium]
MDVGRYLVGAHLQEGRPVAALARDHGLHRSWIYELLARCEREREAGLARRSRRPHGSPTAVSDELKGRSSRSAKCSSTPVTTTVPKRSRST